MERLNAIVEEGNVIAVGLLVFVLVQVGARAVSENEPIRTWGKRLALGSFVAYIVYGSQRFSPAVADDWVGVVFRAGLVAGLALGSSWIVLAILCFAVLHLIGAPARFGRDRYRRWRTNWAANHMRRMEERNKRLEDAERARNAPARERARREQEEHERRLAAARVRRDDARMRCELLYDRHAAVLQTVFPRNRFEAFLKMYMSDEHSAEQVEERAANLCKIVVEAVETPSDKGHFGSIKELADHFVAKRGEIDVLPYDDDVKDTLRGLVNAEERKAIARLLS